MTAAAPPDEAPLAAAHLTVCQELGCEPCTAFLHLA